MNLLKFFKRDKTPVRLCKDCKWHVRGILYPWCKSPHIAANAPRDFSYVDGSYPAYKTNHCEDERNLRGSASCGRSAKYFTPKS